MELAKAAFRVTEYGDDLAAAMTALGDAEGTAFLIGADRLFLLSEPDPAQVARAMPDDRSPRWRSLDTAVLHRLLIPSLWGIPDDEKNIRVVHDDAARALKKARRKKGTAVILNPLKVPDVLAVAAQGEKVSGSRHHSAPSRGPDSSCAPSPRAEVSRGKALRTSTSYTLAGL